MRIARQPTWLVVLACLGSTSASAQVPSDLQQAMRERQKAVEEEAPGWQVVATQLTTAAQ